MTVRPDADATAGGMTTPGSGAGTPPGLAELLAAERAVPIPAPPGLAERAVQQVRAHRLRTPTWLATEPGQPGTLRIRDRVLETLARDWVLDVPGVRTATVLFDGDRLGVDVAARYGVPLPALGDAIRAAVRSELASQIGAASVAVDIRFTDVRRAA